MLSSRLWGLSLLLRCAQAYTSLSDESLRSIAEPGKDFDIHDGALLAPILIPRVPGTPGSTRVLTHFVNFFQESLPDWHVSFQNSTSVTPTSNGAEVPFVNLIATRDPPWTSPGQVGRLALVAHYDSKLTPEGFIGATDSAAPCAMLLHAARSLDEALTAKWAAMEAEGLGSGGFDGIEDDKGVMILLLDGEEAFQTWTHKDSIYGARSLAEEWEHTMNPAASTYRTPLDSIDLFVLLDLLGSADPSLPSYFKTTHWAYEKMAGVEKKLRALGQFKSSPNHSSKRADIQDIRAEPQWLSETGKSDTDRWLGGLVEDDHLPFIARGVDILHMIPTPFPAVWHKSTDDGEHLDIDTVEDWAKLVTAFSAEWLDLEGFMTKAPGSQKQRAGARAVNTKDELFLNAWTFK